MNYSNPLQTILAKKEKEQKEQQEIQIRLTEIEEQESFEFEADSLWQVSTESYGHSEKMTDLGFHEGHIFDVARNLSNLASRTLYFKRIVPKKHTTAIPVVNKQVAFTITGEIGYKEVPNKDKKESVTLHSQEDQLRALLQHTRENEQLTFHETEKVLRLQWNK